MATFVLAAVMVSVASSHLKSNWGLIRHQVHIRLNPAIIKNNKIEVFDVYRLWLNLKEETSTRTATCTHACGIKEKKNLNA